MLRDGVDAGDVTVQHELAYLTEVVLSAFVGDVMSWTLRDDYDFDAHLRAAARIVARAIEA